MATDQARARYVDAAGGGKSSRRAGVGHMIAALYVDPRGCYSGLSGVDLWGEDRDARNYAGPHPVVAHPPCNLWVNFAAQNWQRYGRQKPAWYPGGDDGGCFAAALAAIRKWGGVLEHPAFTHAWAAYDLPRPNKEGGWSCEGDLWVCEVWQSAYGASAPGSHTAGPSYLTISIGRASLAHTKSDGSIETSPPYQSAKPLQPRGLSL